MFDLLVCLMLAWAVWNGWRKGCIVQLCGLAGVVVAVWTAARFGPAVGAWCRVEGAAAAPCGFFISLIVTLLAVAIVGRALRKLIRFAGLGFADVALGIAVAVVKYLLVLSALCSAFDRLNADFHLVEPCTLEQSKTYRPLLRVSDELFPFIEQMRHQTFD